MLNELLEDYQEYNEDEAYDEFISMLWNSKYGMRTYKKVYTFKIQPKALNNDERLINLFKSYQKIEVRYAKSYYNDSPTSIDMIRIRVNSMYLYLTNHDVFLSKEYYDELLKPRNLYYQTIKAIKDGKEIDVDEIINNIKISNVKLMEIKERDIAKKIDLTFTEYKKLINEYILRLFNNYKPPHQYEIEHGWELKVDHDGWHEDNYIVKYFCKSLTGYMQSYVKSLNVKIKHCQECGEILNVTGNRQKYCLSCSKEKERLRQLRKWHTYKSKYINKKLPI